MKFADRNSDLSRFTAVPEIIEAMLHNERVVNEDQTNPTYVTDALKYTNRPKKRRKPQPYEGDETHVERSIDLFGFDEGPMPFQVESWQTLRELDTQRSETTGSQAALVTAPTGIGKTECFLGPILDRIIEERGESTILVYPRRSLLQDQFGRLLKHLHDIKTSDAYDVTLSVGLRFGDIPLRKEQVPSKSALVNQHNSLFKLTKCWCEDDDGEQNPFFLNSGDGWYQLRCPNDHKFGHQQVVLHRNGLRDTPPNIILTTLESLELMALKPNYQTIDQIDTIVLDEVHLLNGTYGAHAAHILQNIKELAEDPFLFIGASATLDGPDRFARKLFGLADDAVTTIEPEAGVDYELGEEKEHYYFHLGGEDVGVASTYLQQVMLLGHSLLQPQDSDANRRKILSFIDSVSQVNQRHAQFIDADSNRSLWEYHAADYTNRTVTHDWQAVANARGNEFIDHSIWAGKGHAGDPLRANEIRSADLLTSTSYMEVGIDVPDIKVITQYRSPFNLSSFVQRAGRAARQKGVEAHIATFLSRDTTDANLFHRADRFLNSEITTPLNTQNSIIDWIHRQYLEFYRTADDIRGQSGESDTLHDRFLQTYLTDSLGLPGFYEFIDEPIDEFNDVVGTGRVDDLLNENDLMPLLNQESLTQLNRRLETKVEEINDEIQPLLEFIEVSGDTILHQDNAVNRFFEEIQNRAVEAINEFQDRIEEQLFLTDLDDLEDAVERLDRIERTVQAPLEDDPHETKSRFQKVVGNLQIINGQLNRAASQADINVDDLQPDNHDRFIAAVETISTLLDEEEFRNKQRTRKQIHYLRKLIDELQTYLRPNRPYLSLYAVKALLRAGYYYDQYRGVVDDGDTTIHFVPENYFSETGLSFTLQTPDGGQEEPVSKLVTQLVPFKPRYDDDGRNMMIFQPRVERGDDGLVFDYESRVSGDIRDNIQIPDTIEAKHVYDQSGSESRQILNYCPTCFHIPSGTNSSCPRHGDTDPAHIYAEPLINSRVQGTPDGGSLGSLTFGSLTGQVELEGVRLDITPAYYTDDDWIIAYNQTEKEVISSPETPIGFALDTRGVVWDLDELIEKIDMEGIEEAEQYNDLADGEFDPEACLRHTAAHYLLLAISDVSGATPSELLYGIDEDANQVFVYERTLGGQGVVDLLQETVEDGNVQKVITSFARLGYNEQIENQRLWADDDVIDRLQDGGAIDASYGRAVDKAWLTQLINETRDIAFETVVDSLAEELISTLDRLARVAEDEGLSLDTALELKQAIAQAQIAGHPAPVSQVRGNFAAIDDFQQVEHLLISPDIDGCVENLHVPNCTSVHAQENVVSYQALEAIRDTLLQSRTNGDDQLQAEIGGERFEFSI